MKCFKSITLSYIVVTKVLYGLQIIKVFLIGLGINKYFFFEKKKLNETGKRTIVQ